MALLTYDQIGHNVTDMANNPSFRQIIERWPSRSALADDVSVPVIVVHRWHQRASIPAKYDVRLLDAASARNIPLNWRELMDARNAPNDQHGQIVATCQGGAA